MQYVISGMAETVELVRKSARLYVVYLLFALLPLLGILEATPPIIDLTLAFFSLGWFASRFVYIRRLYQHKALNLQWYKVLEMVIKYGLKLLPFLIVSLLLLVVPLIVMGLWYGRWFATAYLNQGLGLTTRQVMDSVIPALFNRVLWHEFFSQNMLTSLFYQTFKLLILLGLLALKLVMIYMVSEKFTFGQSLSQGFFYLSKHIPLVTSFIFFRIMGNISVHFVFWSVANTIGLFSSIFIVVINLLASTFVALVLDLFIFSYFAKADNRNVIVKNVARWVRSARN